MKTPIYRNPKLLALAKESPRCFRCGRANDGTVVAAHANMISLGKGTGIKAADVPAFLCASCHDAVDGRNSELDGRHERNTEWALAAAHSMAWALSAHPEVFR